MKRHARKPDDPTLMLLRLFRIADLLATVIQEGPHTKQNLQQRTPKTQN